MSLSAAASKTESRKLLLIDDDPAILQLLSATLAPAGHELTSCATGAEALQAIASGHFDLVLLDLTLPDVQGLELLHRLRRLAPATRVVVITADTTPETLLTAIGEQAYEYIRKPFAISELHDVVARGLAAGEEPAIEVISGRPNWFELSLPCTRDAVDRIERFVRQLSPDLGDLTPEVIQALRELVLNAVEWGGGLDPQRRVRISCVHTSRMLLYRIADPGPGFRFEDLQNAAVNTNEDAAEVALRRAEQGQRPGGLGIRFAQAIADELLYNEKQNEVILIKYLDRQPASEALSS
jgi:CheY-like chemotaxis protein